MADEIRFSRSLYSVEAVDAAVAAYAGLATFEVRQEGDDIAVSVTGIDARVVDRLVDAFCNHALFETVRLARGGTTTIGI